ncbi:uncharacterized protein [Antedon mediterranea]|uniref:uncharacterized protein n=1 Tax=Antedon mediterranea TaxID=105859 RepID=UPI003AF95A39
MAAGLLKNVVKLGIGVGAIYVTAVEGVWSQSDQSSLALTRLTSSITVKDNYFEQVPDKNNVSNLVLEKWNSGVKWSFDSLASSPDKIGQLSSTAANSLTGYLK